MMVHSFCVMVQLKLSFESDILTNERLQSTTNTKGFISHKMILNGSTEVFFAKQRATHLSRVTSF